MCIKVGFKFCLVPDLVCSKALDHHEQVTNPSLISLTSDGYGQRLALSGQKSASPQLDSIQAVVVALVGALRTREGERDGRGEGRQRLAHRAVGADEAQLKGASRVLLRRGAGDVEAVALEDGTSRGLSGRVVPVLGSE